MITREDLEELVRKNPGQGSLPEYERIRDVIAERAPGNVLIFGVGRDSGLWIRANQGGTTVFVEHEPEWIRMTREQNSGIEIHRVSYRTRRFLWWWFLLWERSLFMDDLSESIVETDWDVIFVDSPQGHSWKQPGRMKSIYTASVLARGSDRGTHVLIHDSDRTVERIFSGRYLNADHLVEEVDRMFHYLVPASSPSSSGAS